MSFFKKKDRFKGRSLRFESLEHREMLSVAPLSYAVGDSVQIAPESVYPPPTKLDDPVEITDTTATTMTISWDASKMTDIRTTDPFTIERLSINTKGEEVWTKVGTVAYSYTTGLGIYHFELTGLTALTEYTHRISYGSTTLGTGHTDRIKAKTGANEITAEPASSTTIKLSWNFAAKKDTKYDILRSTDGTNWTSVKTVDTSGTAKAFTATIEDLDPATEYKFKIKYYDLSTVVQETQEVTCKTQDTISLGETTTNSVQLKWNANIGGANANHQIQICSGDPAVEANWKNISGTPMNSGNSEITMFLISDLKDDTTYYFRLRYSSTDESGTTIRYTDPVSFSTPSNIKVDKVTDTTAVVTWAFDTKSSTAYYVETRAVGGEWTSSTAITSSKTYTLTNLTVGTTYDVRIRYTSPSSGEVVYSAEETITTAVPTTLESVTKDSVTISWDIPNQKAGTKVSVQRCDGSLKPDVDSNWKTIAKDISNTTYKNEHLGSDKQYYFRVTYTDTNGDEQHTLYISARTNGEIYVEEYSIDSVRLTWDFIPDNTNYTVQMDTGQSAPSNWDNVGSATNVTDRDSDGCTITGLTPGKTYHFRIVYTPSGEKDKQASTSVSVSLLSDSLEVMETTLSTVTLHWAPTGFTGGAQSNKNFVVYYCEISDRNPEREWKQYSTSYTSSQTSCTIEHLYADTQYLFRVAYSGTAAENAQSSTLAVTTDPYPVTISTVTKTTAQLRWSFSTYAHSPNYTDQSGDGKGVFIIQRYTGTNVPPTEADRVSTSSDWTEVDKVAYTSNFCNISGLQPNETYYYRIVYTYKTGEPKESTEAGSTWDFPQATGYSEIVELKTVSNIKSSSIYTNSMLIQWDSSGSSYTLKWRVAGSNTDWTSITGVTTSTNSHTVSGLTADTEYEFRVEYANGTDPTAVLKVSTTKYTPSVIDREIGVSTATATVQMDCVTGESNFVLHYRLKTPNDSNGWTPATGFAATVASGKVSITIDSLLPEQEYEFKIVYKAGSDEVESEVFSTTLTEELIPSNITNSSVKIEWLEASFPDKRSSSGYTVQRREKGTETWKSGTSTTSLSYTVTGLDPNKEYEIRLMYTTTGNETAYSTIKTITTTQPTITATTPQVGTVKLAWAFGGAVGSYRVEYKGADGVWCHATTVTSKDSREATFTTLLNTGNKLANETEYTFRIVYQTSQGGEDVYTEEVTVTTLSGFQLVDDSITTTSVTLKWDYVTEMSFKIAYCIAGTNAWNVFATNIDKATRQCTVTGLEPDKMYDFQLTYVDGSDQYAVISQIKTTVAAPAAPTSFTTVDLTSNSVTIKWSDNTAFETHYRIEVTNATTGVVFFKKDDIPAFIGSSTSVEDYAEYKLTGLDTNTKYNVKIYAVNAEGSSGVLTGTFTTKDVDRPKAVTISSTTVTPKSITFGWKTATVEGQPDPTKFRIEYEYTDPTTKVKNWYEVTNVVFSPQDEETKIWYGQMLGTLKLGNGDDAITVTIENKTSYNFRITALGFTSEDGVTYGDSTATPKSAKTADLKVPASLQAANVTLTSTTISFKDDDKTLDTSEKTYTIKLVEGKYTDWTKVPENAVIEKFTVDKSTLSSGKFSHALTGLLAGTTYSYVVEWEWAEETIRSKAASFTTKALPKPTTIKTGYTLTGSGELAFQISWKPPAGTKAIPIDGMDISYTIELSQNGKTFTKLVDSDTIKPALSTSPKGLAYYAVTFSDLAAKLKEFSNVDIENCKSLTIRVTATFVENLVEVGSSVSANGKITLPKFS